RSLPPTEPQTPGLVFRATAERAPAPPRAENPTIEHKPARRQSPPQPIRAKRGVDFQKPLRMRRNRADSLHRTLAASTFSKRAGADEQAAAMTGPAAPTEIIFVRVAAASDRAPASIGKVGAIPCGRQDRQAKLGRSRSQ